MTCPVGGPSSVNVSASNNGVTFAAASDVTVTVTDFAVAASPASATVSSGQSAKFTVTVTPQGGPYRSPVTLSCGNLPPQASCSFNPPTVTPGAAAAQSILTIATSVSASVPPSTFQPTGESPARMPAPVLVWVLWPAAMGALWITARRTNRRRAAAFVAASVTFACLASQTMHGGKAAASALRVEPVAPGIAIFPASVDLGSQTIGTTTVPRTVSVTNVGADPLAIGAITAVGDFVSVTNCGALLPAGATCGISVQMTPTAVGTRAGSLSIADNAAGTPHTVTLTGVGVAAPTGGGATPAGAYTVTVSGTVSTLTHANGVILTVQ